MAPDPPSCYAKSGVHHDDCPDRSRSSVGCPRRRRAAQQAGGTGRPARGGRTQPPGRWSAPPGFPGLARHRRSRRCSTRRPGGVAGQRRPPRGPVRARTTALISVKWRNHLMALNGPSGASGLNFNAINNTIYNSIRTQETRLRDTISSLNTNSDGNISQTDLLKLQQQTQQWTMMIELQSTITKQIADSLKGIIQKSS